MPKFGFSTADYSSNVIKLPAPERRIPFTVFESIHDKTAPVTEQTWAQIYDMLVSVDAHEVKNACPLIKMASFGDEPNPNGSGMMRHDGNVISVSGVECDYDVGDLEIEKACAMLERAGIKALLYSSHSSGLVKPPKYTGGPRWRVVAPFSADLQPGQRAQMVARINGVLGGVLADESFKRAQSFYIGKRPGGDYKCMATFNDPDQGEYVDKLNALDAVAIYQRGHSPEDAPDTVYSVNIQPGSLVVAPEVYASLRSALGVIPAGGSNEEWWRVLQGLSRLSNVMEAKAIARDWSTSSSNPEHTEHVFNKEWAALSRRKSAISYSTVFWIANQYDPEWDKDLPVKPSTQTMWEQVDLSNLCLEPVDYLIDDFLARALMVFVGKPGMGKSTAMVAIAAVVAGFEIPGSPLRSPVKGRKIVYITEDIDQFKRNLIALNRNFGFPLEHLASAFVLLPAHRVKAEELLGLRQIINNSTHTHADSGVSLRPWLVFDTTSASFHLEDENSNAEVAAVLALLKTEFYEKMQCSVCMVAHSHKHSTRQDFVADPRGAGAWAGDTTLTSGIFEEDDNRFIMLGKRRYSPLHTELRVDLHKQYDTVRDLYGRVQTVELDAVSFDWSSSTDRIEARESAKDASNLKKSQLIQSQMYMLIEANPMHGANYYIDMTLEQGGPGHSKPLKKKAIEELIASGQVDLVEPEKKGRAGHVLLADPARHAEIAGRYGI